MTPEEFEKLLKPSLLSFMFAADDGMRLAKAVAGLDESQRKRLSKTAKDYWRKVKSGPYQSNDFEFAALVVLAVCPLSDARKVEVRFFQRHEQAAIKLLIDRRPDWMDDWIAHNLAGELPRLSWQLLRGLIVAGVCRKPQSRGYAHVLSWGLLSNRDSKVRVSERLMNEPDLLQDVWLFFEHDICPFYENSQWLEALGELSSQGLIDRQQLLDAALASLFHDVKDDIRAGYVRCYRYLEPTPDERAARQQVFLELLAHRASPVVTFALDELAQLDKQKAFKRDAFLASGKSVFTLKPKSQPLAALKLAASAAKRQAELVPAAISFVLEGLTHDSADVQKQALKLLEGWKSRLHHDHLVEIRERLSDLAASARKQAEALLASTATYTTTPTSGAGVQVVDPATLRSRTIGLDEKWRKLAGVDEALAAIDRNELPQPLEFSLLDVPVLTGAEPVVPIQSVDELLDAVAHSIEVMETGDEIERILDGISRLCEQRPADFNLRAAPLLARIEGKPDQELLHGLRSPVEAPSNVRQLVRSWLSGHPCQIAGAKKQDRLIHHLSNINEFVNLRASEIEVRMSVRRPAPLLAAPTHKSGWLEPCEFVRRLKVVEKLGSIPAADLIQAVLRLAPDNRPQALLEARDLGGDIGRAVRWALGDDAGPLPTDQSSFALWLAAGRARNPYGNLSELKLLLPADKATVAIMPPSFTWIAEKQTGNPARYRGSGAVPLRVLVHTPDKLLSELHWCPTLALGQLAESGMGGFGDSWHTQWLTSIWPTNVDPRFAVGASVLCDRVNAPATTYAPNYTYLMPLLEPDRPWSELGCLVCWIALVSKDASSRGMGIDCLIRAIDDGRAPGERLADVLIRLLSGEWVKLNRVAETFEEIARASPLHAWWTADFLQEFLARLGGFPNDVHHVFTLLLEELVDLGRPLAPKTLERFKSVSLSGKAAKLVNQLLNLESSGKNAKTNIALERALDARIDRVKRWSQIHAQ